MTKVHPKSPLQTPKPAFSSAAAGDADHGAAAVLTVWCKSLIFNFKGFTVFDAKGDLVFRVDNYAAGSRDEFVLMDAAGKPLHTIRRKKLSLGEHWVVHDGEEAVNPRFSVRKHVSLLHSKALAHVTPCRSAAKRSCSSYEIEGSYARRCCAVYGEGRRQVAEIRRKEAASSGVGFGSDVFCLVVQPGFDAALAMAIVILIDQMFG